MTYVTTTALAKPAVQSTTIWSDLSTILLGALGIASATGLIPLGVAAAAGPLVGPALVVAAGAVGLWGRYRPSIQPIQGVFQDPAKRKALEAAALSAAVNAALAARQDAADAQAGALAAGQPPIV